MKCYELQGPQGIDGLALVERDVPKPDAGEVLVRLKAATLNYRDLITVKGGYGSRQKFPLIPVSDGAGVVERMGSNVRGFAPGDRVIGSFFEGWIGGEPSEAKMRSALGGALDGVLAEYRVFPASALVRTPEHLSDIEAAALPCAGLTAWSAVVKLGCVKPGQTVLTQGTGGVSIFALQFAKMCGARVIATSSNEAKIERLGKLGADVTINYKSTPDWGKKAREITGRGVDLVVEVGGVGTLNESIRATRIGGTIAFIGVLAGPPPPELRISLMVMQQQRLQGVTVGSAEDLQSMVDAITRRIDAQIGDSRYMNSLVQTRLDERNLSSCDYGKNPTRGVFVYLSGSSGQSPANRMKPVIDRTFPFEQAKEAFSHMASGAHFGKVAIAIGQARGGSSDD